MMPGIKALRKLQIGLEADTDPGTKVAATALLRFEGLWEDTREQVFPMENIGLISGRDRNYTAKLLAAMAMSGPATFEQLPYILEASIAHITPSSDSGSGFIYDYPFPTAGQGTISTYSIEGGDDQAMEYAAYAFVTDFELSGSSGEVWNVNANWNGRQVVDSDSFTPSTDVSATEVEEAMFLKTKLYIDASTDTIGTTPKSNTLLDASLKVTSGWDPAFTADGNLYFGFIKRPGIEVLLDITFEHDGTATAEKTNWRDEAARQMRLICEGSALATPGVYTYKTMIIDLAGKWEKFDVLGERDGNDVCTGHFRARYNEDAALFANILIVNELSALP
jgi:hypothetical protein